MTRNERERVVRIVDAADGRVSPVPAELREEVARFREDVEWLRPPPAPEPGPWMARRLRAQLEARRRRRFAGTFAAAIFGPGVAVALVLLLLMGRDGTTATSFPPLPLEADTTLLEDSGSVLAVSTWDLSALPTGVVMESMEASAFDDLADEAPEEAVETIARETALGLDLDPLVDELEMAEGTDTSTHVPG